MENEKGLDLPEPRNITGLSAFDLIDSSEETSVFFLTSSFHNTKKLQ
jgi:hypothetical protein